MKPIHLQGVPYDLNSSFLRGPAYAPARIRLMDTEGSANRFAEAGMELTPGQHYHDDGDLNLSGQNPEQAFETIYTATRTKLDAGKRLLSIGGDHSIAFPLIRAHAETYPKLHILQIDAHGDLYENFDDNPFSHASPFARLLEDGQIASLTQVGIRALNTHQREQVKRYGVQMMEMRHFNPDFIHDLQGPLYISLDLDGLDPAFAPGVSHHEPGGLSTRQVLDLLQGINVPVIGADLVEYNPARDVQNMTAMVGYKFMKELLVKLIESNGSQA